MWSTKLPFFHPVIWTHSFSPIGKITEKTQIEFEVPTYFQVMARILQEKCLDLTGRKLGCFPENAGSLDCHLVVSFLPFLKFRTKLRQTDIAHKYLDEWKWSPIPFKANWKFATPHTFGSFQQWALRNSPRNWFAFFLWWVKKNWNSLCRLKK